MGSTGGAQGRLSAPSHCCRRADLFPQCCVRGGDRCLTVGRRVAGARFAGARGHCRPVGMPLSGKSPGDRLESAAASLGDGPGEDAATRAAAVHVVDKYVRSGSVVALGTGQVTGNIFDYLKDCVDVKLLKDIKILPTSDVAASEAAFHGLPQTSIGETDEVDVLFQEVDEIDTASGTFISGRQAEPHQPQLMKARLAAKRAKEVVALLQTETKAERLGGWLPVVIEGDNWEDIAEEIDTIFLGDAEIWRRPTEGTANPRGGNNPYLSPEGHNIIDIRFDGTLKLYGEEVEYEKISNEIMAVAGVVTHGLFLNTATATLTIKSDGPVVETLVVDVLADTDRVPRTATADESFLPMVLGTL